MRDDLIEFYPKLSSNLGVIYNPINYEVTNYASSNNIKIKKRLFAMCETRKTRHFNMLLRDLLGFPKSFHLYV